MTGTAVALNDGLEGCERILRDEFKDYPENAFYMIGSIEEVKSRVTGTVPPPTDSKAEP